MKRSKFTDAQIVSILKLAEQGAKVTDICREHGSVVPRITNGKANTAV